MTARARLLMFLFGAVILAAFLLRGLGGLPAFGRNYSL